jgi:hypothetical protein
MNLRTLLPEEMKVRLDAGVCISCGQPFTSDNVFTDAGRREVLISHTCEKCFDALFDDGKDS